MKEKLRVNETLLAEMAQSEEGGRFYNNESVYRVILIADNSKIDVKSGQRWVRAETLKSILSSSNSTSLQLRCIASLILDLINPHCFR